MTAKTLSLDLTKTRLGLRTQVQNRVTGAVVATPGGQMTIALPVAGLVFLREIDFIAPATQ